MRHVLEIKNITKSFDNYSAFENINYKFESGKVYALTGPSGGGKTTFLNSIGRLIKLDSGTILLDNENIEKINGHKYYQNYVGYLFQNYALVDEDTVLQNLNIVKKHKKSILTNSLKKFGLSEEYLSRKVYTLSGGEAQRIALARLSLQNPEIILADEPTGALDHENRNLVLKSLRNLANENKIVIVATHDDIVKKYADECLDITNL